MLSIDRFEGEFALCVDEQGNIIEVERNLLEDNAKEGDYIFFDDGRYWVDTDKTKAERDEILALQDELFQ